MYNRSNCTDPTTQPLYFYVRNVQIIIWMEVSCFFFTHGYSSNQKYCKSIFRITWGWLCWCRNIWFRSNKDYIGILLKLFPSSPVTNFQPFWDERMICLVLNNFALTALTPTLLCNINKHASAYSANHLLNLWTMIVYGIIFLSKVLQLWIKK